MIKQMIKQTTGFKIVMNLSNLSTCTKLARYSVPFGYQNRIQFNLALILSAFELIVLFHSSEAIIFLMPVKAQQ